VWRGESEHCTVLYFDVLLCCAVLSHVLLCCAVVLCSAVQWSAVQCRGVQCCVVLCCVVLCCVVLCCVVCGGCWVCADLTRKGACCDAARHGYASSACHQATAHDARAQLGASLLSHAPDKFLFLLAKALQQDGAAAHEQQAVEEAERLPDHDRMAAEVVDVLQPMEDGKEGARIRRDGHKQLHMLVARWFFLLGDDFPDELFDGMIQALQQIW